MLHQYYQLQKYVYFVLCLYICDIANEETPKKTIRDDRGSLDIIDDMYMGITPYEECVTYVYIYIINLF